jgi:serine/threonine protein kinase
MPDDSLMGQLSEKFIEEVRKGKLPDIEEYALKHPELAESIRELFPALLILEGMAGPGTPEEARQSELSQGSMFGQYRIEREVGRGGMGIVYEAIHLLLEKRVALKILSVRSTMDANIVPVFDVGQVAGTPYFAMQYIEGRSLDTILRAIQPEIEADTAVIASSDPTRGTDDTARNPSKQGVYSQRQENGTSRFFHNSSIRSKAGLPERLEDYFRWVVAIGIQVANGLAHAHGRKVIHRDIKPSNLIIDGNGVVRIVDFGLARRVEDASVTLSGTLLGTPRYMSPEQADVAKRPLDHRSDIYSLGATLYELLTCHPVFDGKTPHDVISQIITREPIAPRRLSHQIPADLSTIIMKAMAKRREDRYQTASQLAEDLNRWLKTEPIMARRIGPVGWTIRWCRRNRMLVAATSVAVAIIFVLSIFYPAILRHENAKTRGAEERGEMASSRGIPMRTLCWVYRDRHEETIQAPASGYFALSLSPDGTKLAFCDGQIRDRDIWTLNLENGDIKRVTSYSGGDFHPIWSPDGQRIAFTSQRVRQMIHPIDALNGIFSRAADGSGDADFYGALPGKMIIPCSWTKDGRLIVNIGDPGFKNMDIGLISFAGTSTYTPLLESYQESHPQLSPNEKWLAYVSDESGEMNVYVCPFPDVNARKWQISMNGGSSPRCSPDGRELYYLVGEYFTDAVMSVSVDTESTLSPGKPRILFRGKYVSSKPDYGIPYDVHPDGHRFLMMKNSVATEN